MPTYQPGPFMKAIGIGVIAGLRTFSAPAWVAHSERFRSRRALKFLASLELAFDKLPFTPSRITPLPLAARAGSGIISTYLAKSDRRLSLAIVGGISALISAHLAFFIRKRLGEQIGIQDPWIGIAEDTLMFQLGKLTFSTGPTPPTFLWYS
jgi:uncharacterized membrane protein